MGGSLRSLSTPKIWQSTKKVDFTQKGLLYHKLTKHNQVKWGALSTQTSLEISENIRFEEEADGKTIPILSWEDQDYKLKEINPLENN